MLKDPWFWAGIAVGIGAYFALWAVPEPIISKSLAAGITIGLLALWGASEI
jgi:F0F1-type ATP synthase membrane subunit c/vacuolar-type H+-ATPase subunit K